MFFIISRKRTNLLKIFLINVLIKFLVIKKIKLLYNNI